MSDESGLRIVLSPAQLVALLLGDTLGSRAHALNRVWGATKIVSGVAELAGAAVMVATPDPSTATKIAGSVLGLHGLDTTGAGAFEMWTGDDQPTYTQQAGTAAARAFKWSDQHAIEAGIALDIAVPVVVGLGAGALRIRSIQVGRFSLFAEEDAGGHTLLKHIAKDEQEFRARIAQSAVLSKKGIQGASAFFSIQTAESAISRGLRSRAPMIQAWARSGAAGKYAFQFDAGAEIGHGVITATGKYQMMRRCQIVLVRSKTAGKLYYVLTAFPIP